MDEGHRFILPGAEIRGYSEDQNLSVSELAARYPLFAVRLALNDSTQNGGCAECKIIGQRLDIRGRQSSAELKEMFLEGKVFQHLFVREILMESPAGNKAMYVQTLAQTCR
jgi:glycerol-3-phosphate O-acyltransferase